MGLVARKHAHPHTKDLEFLRELKRLGFSFRKFPASELHPKWQAEEIGVFAIQRAASRS